MATGQKRNCAPGGFDVVILVTQLQHVQPKGLNDLVSPLLRTIHALGWNFTTNYTSNYPGPSVQPRSGLSVAG